MEKLTTVSVAISVGWRLTQNAQTCNSLLVPSLFHLMYDAEPIHPHCGAPIHSPAQDNDFQYLFFFLFFAQGRNEKNSTQSATTPACCAFCWLRLTVDVRASHRNADAYTVTYRNVGVFARCDRSAIDLMVKIK